MCSSLLFAFCLRVAHVGGNSNNGANDGLWYWNLNNSSSNANWNCGARVFIFVDNNCIFTHHLPQP